MVALPHVFVLAIALVFEINDKLGVLPKQSHEEHRTGASACVLLHSYFGPCTFFFIGDYSLHNSACSTAYGLVRRPQAPLVHDVLWPVRRPRYAWPRHFGQGEVCPHDASQQVR